MSEESRRLLDSIIALFEKMNQRQQEKLTSIAKIIAIEEELQQNSPVA